MANRCAAGQYASCRELTINQKQTVHPLHAMFTHLNAYTSTYINSQRHRIFKIPDNTTRSAPAHCLQQPALAKAS